MASPVGHTLVGLGVAAALVQASGWHATPSFWIGAAFASNLPDIDWLAVVAGLPRRQAHRSATHSLVILGALGLIGGWLWTLRSGDANPVLGVALGLALVSHPLIDALTTSPGAAAAGFGIPLFWPFLSWRWTLQPPITRTPDFLNIRSFEVLWQALVTELCFSGLAFTVLVLLGFVFRSAAALLRSV